LATTAFDGRGHGIGMSDTDATGEAGDGPTGAVPPAVDGWPLVGNTVQFMRDPFGFYDRAGTYGDVVRMSAFGREVVQIRHPEPIRRLLVEEQDRYRKSALLRDATAEIAPEGLFAVEGEQWRRIREVVQPSFTARAVQSYADVVVEETAALAERLDDGQRIDVAAATKSLTLDVLGRSMFGQDFRDLAGEVADATEAINDRLEIGSVSRLLPPWVPTPTNRRFRRSMDVLDGVIADLVEERRARDAPGEDLFGRLVAARERGALDDAELRDQVFTFLFAGHETTSMALAYTLCSLAGTPSVYDRLVAEADALDGDPTVADLPSLDHTERVVDEGLRLYPPVFALFREPTEDVRIRGYHLPAGTELSLPSYSVHRDERWWDDPLTFDPDRWRGERDRPEYAYFPFGGGPRACIGSRFATLELRLALATLARRVRFDLPADQSAHPDLRMSVTLQPADPIELVVRER
jgi:cytochrome P450